METSVNERIKAIIDHYCSGRQSAFCERTGIGTTTISAIVGTRKTSPGYDILHRIVQNYPINERWLLSGEGEMVSGNVQVIPVAKSDNSNIIDFLKEQLRKKDEQITFLMQQLGKHLSVTLAA